MKINIVFSGGGIKGLAYVGALRFLEDRGYVIQRAAGTSVGSLFAALVIAGYTSKEISNLVDEFDITSLVKYESETRVIKKIQQAFKKKGIFSITDFETHLQELLSRKKIYTFQDVKRGNSYRLKIVVFEVKTGKTVIIPDDLIKYNINPDTFPIAKAVVMSCNIPLFYVPYKIGEYSFFDGGITANYPIWVFNNDPIITYGFRLTRLKDEQKEWLNTIYTYGKQLKNKLFYVPEVPFDEPRTINIMIKEVTMLEFQKGYRLRQKLYVIGYNSTSKYFYQKSLAEK